MYIPLVPVAGRSAAVPAPVSLVPRKILIKIEGIAPDEPAPARPRSARFSVGSVCAARAVVVQIVLVAGTVASKINEKA